jgi:hypothetical protein
MAVLLFCVGAVTLLSGIVMAGYGLPVREFNFGNTLIIAGIMATVGGLIIIALGMVVSQLQQIAWGMGQSALRESRRKENYGEAPQEGMATDQTRPPATRELLVREAYVSTPRKGRPTVTADVVLARDPRIPKSPGPTLPNPERLPGAVEGANWKKSWPAGRLDADSAENRAVRRRDFENSAQEKPTIAPEEGFSEGENAQDVPVLKSGVIDGMGYTLYVDGSIEADLPQGTIRFASIDELRSHLEKTS